MTREDFVKITDEMMDFLEWLIIQWQEKCGEKGLIPFHALSAMVIPQDYSKRWVEGYSNISRNVDKRRLEIIIEGLKQNVLFDDEPFDSEIELQRH